MFYRRYIRPSSAIFFFKIGLIASCLLAAPLALAATLSVSPATGVYQAGETFTARVVVNTAGAKINAAEGTLTFKPTELTVVGVSKGSIFNLWTAEPSFSNAAGTIAFSGGSTPPGFSGAAGTVLTVTFRAKGAGTPKVQFANGSVLAADGKGTNVLTNMAGATFTISAETTSPAPETIIEYVPPANTPAAPVIQSTTHPDPESWSKEKSATLNWTLPAGVTAVRTLLDDRPSSVPTKVYEPAITDINLSDLAEGVQFFHLQFKNADGWGKIAHYRLAIDTTAPTRFDLALSEGADLAKPEQVLVATVEDAVSPVRRFRLQIDGGSPLDLNVETGSTTLTLPALTPGYHTVVAEAFDAAGNSITSSVAFTILAFTKPQFTDVPTTINAGVVPVFSGVTRPRAGVEVTLTPLGAQAITTEVTSGDDGRFTFIPDGRLPVGVYELTARATDAEGAQSEMSDPVRFAVQEPGFLRIGSLLVDVLAVVVSLLALVFGSVLATGYFWRRWRRVKTGVVREAHEAAAILQREFNVLTQYVTENAEAVRAARKTGKLTKSEDELFSGLTEKLATAKRTITKEITDVEEVVE